MAQSVAQQLTVSMPFPQTVDIQPSSDNDSQAQVLTVAIATGYINVDIAPAQKLPGG